jgi:hypothetical protein
MGSVREFRRVVGLGVEDWREARTGASTPRSALAAPRRDAIVARAIDGHANVVDGAGATADGASEIG